MLLNHPTTAAAATETLLFHRRQPSSPYPDRSHSLSFPSGSELSSSSLLKPLTVSGNPVSLCITFAFPSKSRRNGTVDYEKRPAEAWFDLYKRLAWMPDPENGAASVLTQCENEGLRIPKSNLSRVVRQLRKVKQYKLALEVLEWMKTKPERFWLSTGDIAIKLDLISKLHGASSAEDYFKTLGDSLKDGRVYGSLLNAYVNSKMKEKAESVYATMKEKGYLLYALSCNVMMTLYMDTKEYDKVEAIISEMRVMNIPLDEYSYNIWLTSLGHQSSMEKLELVFESMKADTNVELDWSTLSTMARMYIKTGQFEKAEEYLKLTEDKIEGQNCSPYHYIISLYGAIGKTGEVYRVWEAYKSKFMKLTDMSYRGVIIALVKCGDVQGAEDLYDEWSSSKPRLFDPRIGNILLACYVRNGETEKAETFFSQMVAMGVKPNSRTWEILAEYHIIGKRVADALSCLKDAVAAMDSKNWKPKRAIVSSITEYCDEIGDTASKEVLFEVLKQTRHFDDETDKDEDDFA
ncbi:unnamed protein product [Cuscuta campestris]|uniref:Pentacotripeptide-repeat region of PRORP domain-containing protein n=1 Tax=Cuscuta campestris TaxID=132261 RepID=A0A484L103_9ASTE|nr:unnamed protein product [Cuscuta campestris]